MSIILVIDASPSIRETLRIVLGGEHEVVAATSPEGVRPPAPPALLIVGLPPPPREDGHTGALLAEMAPDAPLLLLNAEADVDLRELALPGRRVDFLPKPFDAYALRARVRSLLEPATPPVGVTALAEHYRRFLEYPFLPHAAALIARQAVATDLPVLLVGEPGTGAVEVARAIHFFSGRRGPFTVAGAAALLGSRPSELLAPAEAAGARDAGTALVEGVEQASPPVQHALLALVRGHDAPAGTPSARVLAATTEDLLALAARGDFLPDLAYALTAIPIHLPPLRQRTDDIPALVESLAARLVTRLRLEPVTFTEAAIERLTRYLWFGNLAELEAVVGRTLALHRARVVDADHLVFVPGDAPAAVAGRLPPPGRARPARPPGAPLATPSLEIVLGELAHELRNPMVTIKTFAQHLESVLADPEARVRFTALTADAIDRMDALLAELLDFARFRAPVLRATDMDALFEQALAEQAAALARKSVRVERNGARAGRVQADEAQLLFALRCLLAGLVRDLVPHEPLRVAASHGGAVEVHARTEPTTAARLAAFVEDAAGSVAAETPPLPFALAAALLHRNGGALRVRSGDGGATVISIELVRSGDEPDTGAGAR